MPVLTFEDGRTMGVPRMDSTELSALLAPEVAEAPAWLTESEELFRLRRYDNDSTERFQRGKGQPTGLANAIKERQGSLIAVAREITTNHGGLTRKARAEILERTGITAEQILAWIPIEGPHVEDAPSEPLVELSLAGTSGNGKPEEIRDAEKLTWAELRTLQGMERQVNLGGGRFRTQGLNEVIDEWVANRTNLPVQTDAWMEIEG